MGFAVVVTANHFVVDVVGGFARRPRGARRRAPIERATGPATLDQVGRQPASSVRRSGPRPFLVAHRAGNHVEPSGSGGARRRARRGRRPPLPRAPGGPPSEDGRAAPAPLGSLGARRSVAPTPPSARAARGDARRHGAHARPKGWRGRLAELVVDELAPYLGERRFTVCARRRQLLEPFEGLPVRSGAVGRQPPSASLAAAPVTGRPDWTGSRSTSACSTPESSPSCGRSPTWC